MYLFSMLKNIKMFQMALKVVFNILLYLFIFVLLYIFKKNILLYFSKNIGSTHLYLSLLTTLIFIYLLSSSTL